MHAITQKREGDTNVPGVPKQKPAVRVTLKTHKRYRKYTKFKSILCTFYMNKVDGERRSREEADGKSFIGALIYTSSKP